MDRSEPSDTPTGDVAGLVSELTGRVADLYSVPETSEVVVADALERLRADAAALLVADGARWRVAAGRGLRPREHDLELTESSWLVREVARTRRGALIENSDVVREQLSGVPLASRRHLAAAPVPDVPALLMIAREQPPFQERDLISLAALATEAAPLLAAAVATRTLARALAGLRDEPREPGP